ncbi:TPA: ABC-F family ATP-binding cassette domain-containing protein, partial [Streptococcus agalactiae]|nr:ABC-F family ATP-binding cassette domain-containing protein [Streptococcus agalactiae]
LKILVGEEAPTKGEINKKRDLSLSYLAQDSRFQSENTIFQEMLQVFDSLREVEKRLRELELQMGQVSGSDLEQLMKTYDILSEEFREKGGFTYESDIKAILNGFKFNSDMWEMPISELSGGQNTRLALAKMLLEKPELLVLDEPTNHLDIDTIAWLENYLVNYQGALIIVSHDRYFLDKVATVTYDLTTHSLDRYVGNYSKFMDLKAEKIATEEKNFEKQQKEIAKLEDFVQRNIVRASTTKRAQARRKQLEKMERLDKPNVEQKSANMTFHAGKVSGNVVLTLENAAIGYEGVSLSEPIDLDVKKFDAIAIVGPNGIGKSTLIKSLVGQIPFIKGEAKLGANVETGYYDQSQSNLTKTNTVLDELWDAFSTTPEVEIRNRLGAFLFSGDDVKKSVSMLSGGERARLLLAKLSMENNNFLILDEPTNHLDIDSKEVLENALIEFDGTLLFVSHDRYFINRVATKVLEISDKGSTLYLGDYDYYLTKKAELEELARLNEEEVSASKTEIDVTSDYETQKANQKEFRKITRRVVEIEARLEVLENDENNINGLMLETNDIGKLSDLQKELESIQEEQLLLMEEWENLNMRLDL